MYIGSLSLAKCALRALRDVDPGENETASKVKRYTDIMDTVIHGYILNVLK